MRTGGDIKVNQLITIMPQRTDTDIQEIKDLITGLREEIRVGFSDINGKLEVINTRLTGIDKELKTVDTAITKLDTRIWSFGGFALTISVGSLLTVFIRYMLSNPKF
jgi:hypothetical protein